MSWQADPKADRFRVSGREGSGDAHAASQMNTSQLAMLLCHSCCETLKESRTRELLCAHKIWSWALSASAAQAKPRACSRESQSCLATGGPPG